MLDFKEQIADKISKITNLEVEDIRRYIEIPPNADLGDYTFPCFTLSKVFCR